MGGWMGGWMDGWMNGWGRTDGWICIVFATDLAGTHTRRNETAGVGGRDAGCNSLSVGRPGWLAVWWNVRTSHERAHAVQTLHCCARRRRRRRRTGRYIEDSHRYNEWMETVDYELDGDGDDWDRTAEEVLEDAQADLASRERLQALSGLSSTVKEAAMGLDLLTPQLVSKPPTTVGW